MDEIIFLDLLNSFMMSFIASLLLLNDEFTFIYHSTHRSLLSKLMIRLQLISLLDMTLPISLRWLATIRVRLQHLSHDQSPSQTPQWLKLLPWLLPFILRLLGMIGSMFCSKVIAWMFPTWKILLGMFLRSSLITTIFFNSSSFGIVGGGFHESST